MSRTCLQRNLPWRRWQAALSIATLTGEPEKATIFGYERGATMDYDFLAPARRAFVFLDNDTFGNLMPAGLALFDAAVRWSVADPASHGAPCRS